MGVFRFITSQPLMLLKKIEKNNGVLAKGNFSDDVGFYMIKDRSYGGLKVYTGLHYTGYKLLKGSKAGIGMGKSARRYEYEYKRAYKIGLAIGKSFRGSGSTHLETRDPDIKGGLSCYSSRSCAAKEFNLGLVHGFGDADAKFRALASFGRMDVFLLPKDSSKLRIVLGMIGDYRETANKLGEPTDISNIE